MFINPKVVRSSYIGKTLKDLFEEKGLSVSEVALKIWTSQPNLSNALNWKKVFSDKFFTKVWKVIWLQEIDIKNIFKEADIEEFMFKHKDDIPTTQMTIGESLEWIKEKAGLSDNQIIAIKAIIDLEK